MAEPVETCSYCGATGYPDVIARRECCQQLIRDNLQAEKDNEDEEEEPDFDEEFMERKRIVEEVSRRVGGLTSSEVNDIMNDY